MSDLKFRLKKKCIVHHWASVQAKEDGGRTPNLTPMDNRIAAIIGERVVIGDYAEGDMDLLADAASEGMLACS